MRRNLSKFRAACHLRIGRWFGMIATITETSRIIIWLGAERRESDQHKARHQQPAAGEEKWPLEK